MGRCRFPCGSLLCGLLGCGSSGLIGEDPGSCTSLRWSSTSFPAGVIWPVSPEAWWNHEAVPCLEALFWWGWFCSHWLPCAAWLADGQSKVGACRSSHGSQLQLWPLHRRIFQSCDHRVQPYRAAHFLCHAMCSPQAKMDPAGLTWLLFLVLELPSSLPSCVTYKYDQKFPFTSR